MQYPVFFEKDPENGYLVSFRDIPEAISCGETLDEAREMALDALVTAMDFYFEDRRMVPPPSEPIEGEELITLPESVAVKVQLLNARLREQVRPVDLAQRMGIKRQEVNRILDLHHKTKIDTLSAAFAALGYKLEIKAQRL
ncbi:MAG: type II toxin-antitoxin system HicB family antitoxin [Comamonadaceae bacterium]|nr:type II toxin-antitoxin system HicB family antitoxin [Comamonadaceae bacterium]